MISVVKPSPNIVYSDMFSWMLKEILHENSTFYIKIAHKSTFHRMFGSGVDRWDRRVVAVAMFLCGIVCITSNSRFIS